MKKSIAMKWVRALRSGYPIGFGAACEDGEGFAYTRLYHMIAFEGYLSYDEQADIILITWKEL